MTDRITLDHGSGGRASHQLINRLFLKHFTNQNLRTLEDSTIVELSGTRLAISTDSFVVDPIFFPGGNIGDLAVNGTVNDIAMRGAVPLYLTVGMILEEGLSLDDLERIVASMQEAARQAEVEIVAGDTKVVPKGNVDKIFINTTGIGHFPKEVDISGNNAKVNDAVLLSGTMADHGITILCQQEGLKVSGGFASDSASLTGLCQQMLNAGGEAIHVLRDPTRGGVATTLNEIAESSKVGIRLFETELPVRDDVRGACDLLGLDPLYLANEGKLLAFVSPEHAEPVLAAMREHSLGKEAKIIGKVVSEDPGRVFLQSRIGTTRLIDMLHGHPLPRIC